jgi:pyrroloquinoline quinone (PQQ) biosynthesis protein C
LDYKRKLLDLYDLFPFHDHPLWRAVLSKELTMEEVIRAEIQHYLRTRAGQSLRRQALDVAERLSPILFEALIETFLEECTSEKSGPSHLELIKRLVLTAGIPEEDLDRTKAAPGNAAAIALFRDITERGAGCHMLGAGAVEHYYCTLSTKIYRVYTEEYGMTPEQAETYRIHGPMDREHADRAFRIMDEAVRLHGWPTVEQSVRDAFVATSLHYDGMLQGALGQTFYWNGRVS